MAVCLRTLQDGENATVVAFSSDGCVLVAGSLFDCSIKLWQASDLATGALIHTYDVGQSVSSVAICPSGNRVAAGLCDGNIQIWCVSAGVCLLALTGHGDQVNGVVFSPHDGGRTLASASCDRTARIWDTATGACLHDLRGHTRWLTSIAYSPDRQAADSRLLTGAGDKTVKIWSAATGACLASFRVDGYCCSVTFSPDGRVAVAVCSNGVLLLDAGSGDIVHALRGHTSWVNSICVSNDRLLITGSSDNTVKLWCTKGPDAGTCIATLTGHGSGGIQSVAVSPSGAVLAVATKFGTIRLWDISAFSLKARILALVLAGRRRRREALPHVPQELWRMICDEFC